MVWANLPDSNSFHPLHPCGTQTRRLVEVGVEERLKRVYSNALVDGGSKATVIFALRERQGSQTMKRLKERSDCLSMHRCGAVRDKKTIKQTKSNDVMALVGMVPCQRNIEVRC